MSKRFVFNMGYDTSHVTSVLASEGLNDGSEVFLIVPMEIEERQRNSINDIRNYLDTLDFNVELICFEAEDSLESNIPKFAELFSFSGKTLLSLSGGPRDHLIPLTLAASLKGSNIEGFYFRSDISAELEKMFIPDLSPDLSSNDEEILQVIDERYMEPQDIVSEVEISKSTIYRRLNHLKERNLVDEKELNGSSSFRASSSAKILIDI